MAKTYTFDPDVTRRDEAPYWAAALVHAIRSGNTDRKNTALENLRRLGMPLTVGEPRKRKGAGNV